MFFVDWNDLCYQPVINNAIFEFMEKILKKIYFVFSKKMSFMDWPSYISLKKDYEIYNVNFKGKTANTR